MSARPTIYRIPYSTNVERVALALGHKGITADWVDVDPADRSPVEQLSGQPLVPVLEAPDGTIVRDSTAIVAWLEREQPEPALWPADRARRAEADVFVEWFNVVWKRPPNAIAAELEREQPDAVAIARWSAEIARWLPWFEALLREREFLLGQAFGVADLCAYPFLRYGVHPPAADDEDPFHPLLAEHLSIAGEFPRLEAWVRRIDARPRG